MRISDWSSDVCSSDLSHNPELPKLPPALLPPIPAPVRPPVPCGFHRSRYCPPKDRGSIPAPALHDSATSAQILPPDRPRPTCRRKRTRSEERRVGKEWVRTCSSRGWPAH